MTGISEGSAKRFRALIGAVSAVAATVQSGSRFALADRVTPTKVHCLNLDSRSLGRGQSTYDVIILDSEASRRLSTAVVGDLLARLRPDGVIAIRHRPRLMDVLRSLFRRRTDDGGPNPFLRGLPRSGAALLKARLYVRELKVRVDDRHYETWVIGSPAPLGDTRYRDQIGRVATDYLRAVGPIIAGAHLPNI